MRDGDVPAGAHRDVDAGRLGDPAERLGVAADPDRRRVHDRPAAGGLEPRDLVDDRRLVVEDQVVDVRLRPMDDVRADVGRDRPLRPALAEDRRCRARAGSAGRSAGARAASSARGRRGRRGRGRSARAPRAPRAKRRIVIRLDRAGGRPENSRTTRPIASWIARSNWVPSTRMFAPSRRSSRALPSVIWPSTEVKPVAASTSAFTRLRTSPGSRSVAPTCE